MEPLASLIRGPFGGANRAKAETIRHSPPRSKHFRQRNYLRLPSTFAVLSSALLAQSLSFDLATVPTSAPPQSLVVGDFNRDGKPDLAVTENTSVEILLGNGDGTFRSAHVISLGGPATRIAKADFNGDGKLDLAVSAGNFGDVFVLLGNGDGSFQAPADTGVQSYQGPVPPAEVPGLAVGDVNGDGIPDLILGPTDLSVELGFTVILGKGDGTFPARTFTGTTPYTAKSPAVVLADFNGDGKADLFVSSQIVGQHVNTGAQPENFGLLIGSASGVFSTAFWKTGFSGPAVAADVNGNGKPDIVMFTGTGFSPNGAIDLLFQEYLDGNPTPVSKDVVVQGGNFNSVVAMTAADINGDGKIDLLITGSDGDMVPVLGNGDGTFQPASIPTVYLGGTSYFNLSLDTYGSLAAADFFGNGRASLVVALSGYGVSLLKNGATDSPQLVPAGFLNTATSTAIPAVAGSLMTIYGSGLAYGSGSLQAPSDPNNYGVPNRLFGLRVSVNGAHAGLLYASPNQVNIQTPWEVAGLSEAVLVVTRNGISQSITIPVAPAAPGLFTMNQQGSGQAAAIVSTGQIAAPVGAFPGSRPIHPGEYLALYGTGLGAVNISYDLYDGLITPPPSQYCTNICVFRTTLDAPVVTVGGVPAMVQFSGLAPYTIGTYQINILIPPNAPVGNAVPIVLKMGTLAANTVTVAIQ